MPTLVAPGASMARRLGVLLVGLVLVATGVASTINAELGVAPYDVVTTGLHERFGVPLGFAAFLLPLLFAALGRILGGHLGLGTAIATVLVGPILGVMVEVVPEPAALLPRLGLYGLGFAGIAAGVVLVILPELGAGPAELLMLAIAGRGVALAPARTAIELGCVAVGFALGGQVGAGTLAFAVLIGPALRWGLQRAGYSAAEAAVRSDAASPGA
jgi:uncharacterized membrane protein YczE